MMLADVQSSYGLDRPLQGACNFETEHQRPLIREVCAAIQTGRLVVISSLIGSGKTHLLRLIEAELTKARKVSLAKSLAVDKRRTSLPSLIEALFYDLSPGDRAQVKIPKQAERRERDLRGLMKKGKRLVEVVADAGVPSPCFWSGIPGFAMICVAPRWRNSVTRQPFSITRGWAPRAATMWHGCLAHVLPKG
ncbi:hypothetical protein [Dickeya dianthicola]|uniref:hypothetical protein n=1 Tax=Dickeya dianthicola TaxID=204039 RepID=UPI001D001DF8|nr:hypothetical protein [Dickeya dianthicola]